MSDRALQTPGSTGLPPACWKSSMAAVRPEFRADEIAFDPADPVFGGAICRVASCPRTARGGRGLCAGSP